MPYLHPDFFAIAPSYVPLGGRRHTAESFRDEVMPHLAKMLDFTHFKYESLVAEEDQVVALVSIGIADTDDSVLISEHWTVRDGKALSLLVLFFEPQKLLEQYPTSPTGSRPSPISRMRPNTPPHAPISPDPSTGGGPLTSRLVHGIDEPPQTRPVAPRET